MNRPNLFLVGGAKCGTTSMASYLAEHPRICWSEPKELWYFCRPDLPNRTENAVSLEEYLGHFSGCGPEHLYIAEGSVSYLYAKGAARRILEFNPEAKFIVMVRNPLEAVVSLHRQMLMNMQESEADFDRAWDLQGERRQGKYIPMKCENAKYLMYRDWCLWGEQLARLFHVVGRDRVCVIVFDDFKSDPAAEYERILNFLGLESDHRTDFPIENKGRSYRNQRLINVLDAFIVLGSRLRRRLALPMPVGHFTTLLQRMKQRQLIDSKPMVLSSSTTSKLVEAFRSDVELLSSLLGRDLLIWLDSDA